MPLPRWHDLAAQAGFPANRRPGQRVKLAPTAKRALGIPTDARIHSHPSDLAGTSSPRPLPATDAPLGNPSVVRLDELMATDSSRDGTTPACRLASTTDSSGQRRGHGESSPPFGLSLFVLGSWSRQCRVELFHRGVFRDARQPLEIPINLRWSGLTLVDCDSHQNDTAACQSGSSIGPISA